MVAAAVDTFGRLDVAVNNAGIAGPSASAGEYPVDGWREVMAVHLDGTFYCCRAEIAVMRKAGGGAIVSMASILGSVGFQSAPAYVAAKHGIVGLIRAAALDHAADGLRVNAVGPASSRHPCWTTHHRRSWPASPPCTRWPGSAPPARSLSVWVSSPRTHRT